MFQCLVAVTEGVRQLDTIYAAGKSRDPVANTTNTTVKGYDFAVSNVIEGLWNTDPEQCFISVAEEGGVVMIDIPWSMVTHVRLLNGIDHCKCFLDFDKLDHFIPFFFDGQSFLLEVNIDESLFTKSKSLWMAQLLFHIQRIEGTFRHSFISVSAKRRCQKKCL